MNLFAMKATYPLDELTYTELTDLMKKSQLQDAIVYDDIMHKAHWKNFESKGFFILAYDEDEDLLIGALNATDPIGLNTFEWSLVVDPKYREMGLEDVLIEGLKHSLEERQAAGEMAVVYPQQKLDTILEENNYSYSSSKIQMQALPIIEDVEDVEIVPYEETNLAILQKLMADGFGDLLEETADFVQMIKEEQQSAVWMVKQDDQIVATLTTAIEGSSLWLNAFTTAIEFRNKGIATSVLKWLKNYASEQQLKAVLLEVETENPQAISLYQKAGFVNIEQINYYVTK